ncbi:MAG TPA: SIR2 family protein, partial [Pyrinomonadaceae bacterium]
MANGLPKIPESLETALKNGKVIPFVGSGISRMVQRNDSTGKPLFPSWRGYIEILAEALDNKGKSKAADYIRDCLNTKPPDYLEAMQIAFNQLGETVWDKLLDDHFDFEKKEAVENSLELPRLIWQLGSNLIITTNIDKVLQWSCLHPEEFKLLDIQKKEFGKLHKEVDPKCPTVIYLHGHIDNKANIIFTKEQYKLFYDFKVNEAKLETLKTLLTRRTFLFLGFSLDDPYFLQQIEYFHKLYDGGADSLFVVIHKNEKDNPNIPKFIGKVVFEGYGEPLLNLLKQLAIIAPKTTDIEISETNNLNSVISLNQANTTSNLSKTTEEELRDKIRKTNDTSDKTGDYQDSEIFSTQQSKTFKNRLQKSLLITLVCLLITVGLGYCFFNNQPTKTMPIDSIAVLPLQNESLDPDTEYLANGLTRDLIFRLAQLPNIKVSPTSSVIRYKGKETDTKKIANDLSVNAVMSGGIVKRGESLIISVELEDV